MQILLIMNTNSIIKKLVTLNEMSDLPNWG